MTGQSNPAPNALAAYTVVLLHHADRYLLLKRAANKRFAPGRWTGIGGLVEGGEFGDLRAAALRELREETGIEAAAVDAFTLRRALLHARPGGPLTVLLYFTGSLRDDRLPDCAEGTLAWVAPEELAGLDVIETTRPVLPLLIADEARDPAGGEPVRLGVAHYRPDGAFERVIWA